ncbi:MAG: putative glycoside hydrolase [Chloroflexia bacterium]
MDNDASRLVNVSARRKIPPIMSVVWWALLPVLAVVVVSVWFGWFRAGSVAATSQDVPVVDDPSLLIPGMPMCYPAPTTGLHPTPVAEASAVVPAGVSPFGLAWFHKPPQDGTTAQQLGEQSSYIHLTGTADIPFRDQLRAAGYKGPILTYTTMNAVEGPGPYKDSSATCDASYTPHDNQLAFYSGDFCKYIHGNESWFLHNSAGARIVDDYFSSGRYSYVMNPADPGWRAFAIERLKVIKSEWFYDGIWLDNVDVDRARVMSELTNSDGIIREYDSDDAWREAVSGWLAEVRQALGDYPLWANLVGGGLRADSWDAYAPYLDGAMDESFAVQWLDGWRGLSQWQAQIQRAEKWIAAGKGLIAVGQGPQDDAARMKFTLASYLLVAQGSQATFRYTRFDSYYSQMWIYPEYDSARKLGAPLGGCYEVSTGVWRRDFEHGHVEVDVQGHQGRLVGEP